MAGGDKCVSVEEAAPFGGVIPGLEVIELGFLDIVLATGRKMGYFRAAKECRFLTHCQCAGSGINRLRHPEGSGAESRYLA